MSTLRTIKSIVTGRPAVDGAGVKLVRVLGPDNTRDFDPFLLLDAFDSSDPADYTAGFPWHPHRGIETVTYLLSGDIEHGDSLGNSGSILDGDCQWMTAGSGIIHQEMPQASERMLGAQLWLNLAASDKMTQPAYGDIQQAEVPLVQAEGSTVRVLAGAYLGTPGAFEGRYVKSTYLDVALAPGQVWSFSNDPAETLFTYAFSGEALYDPALDIASADGWIAARQAVLFGQGETLWVKAGDQGVRFILLSALPLHEPIAWGGPIVMNTQEELDQAFAAIEDGTFIPKPQGES